MIHHKFYFFGDEILKSNALLNARTLNIHRHYFYFQNRGLHQVLAECYFWMAKLTNMAILGYIEKQGKEQ